MMAHMMDDSDNTSGAALPAYNMIGCFVKPCISKISAKTLLWVLSASKG